MNPHGGRRTSLPFLLMLIPLSGCTAANTYMAQRNDLAMGGPQLRLQASEQRLAEAQQTNTALQAQQAELDALLVQLQQAIDDGARQVQALDDRIRDARHATAEQHAQYEALRQRRQKLLQSLAAARQAPPAANDVDADTARLQVEALQIEKNKLDRQVQLLTESLKEQ